MADLELTFPYEIEILEGEDDLQIRRDFPGYLSGSLRVLPMGYFLPGLYKDFSHRLYNFRYKPSDVIIMSYPKSGTTWMEELLWLVRHNLDYPGAKVNLDERIPFVEADIAIDYRLYTTLPEMKERLIGDPPKPDCSFTHALNLPDPRIIKTHLPFSLLHPSLLDTCKVVYVARDPHDVIVSYYHHHRLIRAHGFKNDFATFFDYFINEKVIWSPIWQHLNEAHKHRDHPNLLVITYEQMKTNLQDVIHKVAKFLGKQVPESKMAELCTHLNVESMKNNPAVNGEEDYKSGLFSANEEGFIRKGKSGGGRNYMDDKMKNQFSKWIQENSNGCENYFDWNWID